MDLRVEVFDDFIAGGDAAAGGRRGRLKIGVWGCGAAGW